MGKAVLLIDGDSVAFKAACANQQSTDWGDGVSVDVDHKGAEAHMASALASYQDALNVDRMIVCLGGGDNWRKKLWPAYKANRKDKERPILLPHCYQHLTDNYEVEAWPRLEADDVMGILATTIKDSIIVSVDKDMRSVPCRLYNPGKPEEGIVWVDEVMAHEWHMKQTLMGDTADGYSGVPGIGPKKAEKIVRTVFENVDPIRNYSAWRIELWKAVVNSFVSSELTPEDALMQARMAYILRHPHEYNRKTSKLKLWRPPT